jgi:tetratricopeptide (TPR) repeat protein
MTRNRWMAAAIVLAVVAAVVIVTAALHQPVSPKPAATLAGEGGKRAHDRAREGGRSTNRGDLEKTITAMDERLARAPQDAGAAVALADALLRQTRVTGNAGLAMRAESALNTVLAAEPSNYSAHRMLATVYLSQHRFADAIGEAQRCCGMRSDDAWAYGVLGDANIELGNYKDAFDAFDRMTQLRPDAASYARASYARELQGDLDGALRLMTMAAEATAPQDPESLAWHHAQLGHLHLQMGRISDARREYEHADYVFHDHPFAKEGLARVEAAQGNYRTVFSLVK